MAEEGREITQEVLQNHLNEARVLLEQGKLEQALEVARSFPQILSLGPIPKSPEEEKKITFVRVFKHAGMTIEQLEAILSNPDLASKLITGSDVTKFTTNLRDHFDQDPMSWDEYVIASAVAAAPEAPTAEGINIEEPTEEPKAEEPKVEEIEPPEPDLENLGKSNEPRPAVKGLSIGAKGGEVDDIADAELVGLKHEVYDDINEWLEINTLRSVKSMQQSDMMNRTQHEPFCAFAIEKDKLDLSAILGNAEQKKAMYEKLAELLDVAIDNIHIQEISTEGRPSVTGIWVNSLKFTDDGHCKLNEDHSAVDRLNAPITLDLAAALKAASEAGADAEKPQAELAQLADQIVAQKSERENREAYERRLLAESIPYLFRDNFEDAAKFGLYLGDSFSIDAVNLIRRDNGPYSLQWQLYELGENGAQISSATMEIVGGNHFTTSEATDAAVIELAMMAQGSKSKVFAIDENNEATDADFLKGVAVFQLFGIKLDAATQQRANALLQKPDNMAAYKSEIEKFQAKFAPEEEPKIRVDIPGSDVPGP